MMTNLPATFPSAQRKPLLLALDLDGTTLNDEGVLTEKNAASLTAARQLNAIICFVTGRSDFDISPLKDILVYADYLIMNNGSKIIHIESNTVLERKTIEPQQARLLVDHCLERNHLLYVKSGIFWGANTINESVKDFAAYLQRFPDIYQSVAEIPLHDLDGFSINTQEALQSVNNLISQENLNLYTLESEPNYYDILSINTSKWNGIKVVAAQHNISTEDIIAAGNYINDIDMIQHAGIGIAVKNASDEVKEAANYVTFLDNNQNVIGEIVYHFILHRDHVARILKTNPCCTQEHKFQGINS